MYFRILNEFLLKKWKLDNGENLETVLGPLSAQGLGLLVRPSGPERRHNQRFLYHEVFSESSGVAAGWHRTRLWVAGLTGVGRSWRRAEMR
jgi:hypothetical protein